MLLDAVSIIGNHCSAYKPPFTSWSKLRSITSLIHKLWVGKLNIMHQHEKASHSWNQRSEDRFSKSMHDQLYFYSIMVYGLLMERRKSVAIGTHRPPHECLSFYIVALDRQYLRELHDRLLSPPYVCWIWYYGSTEPQRSILEASWSFRARMIRARRAPH